jgi:RNA polymerase sigma-70 factor (ECF subfamily)
MGFGLEASVRDKAERRILAALRQGRRQAYETVIDAHYGSVYRFLLFLTGEGHLAEDLTQEVFASAWEALDRFRGRASMKTWLHRIAYNAFVDAQRRRTRDVALVQGLSDSRPDPAGDPVDELVAAEQVSQMVLALSRLESDDRAVLALRYVEALSYREMAQVLGRPNGTLRWLTSRAVKRLADELTGKAKP